MTPGLSITWREWSTEAFADAHRLAMPVLLWVGTTWSAASRRLEREVLADASVVRDVASRFVAVRVDADRRPDIADRYRLDDTNAGDGVWSDRPTLACLTPGGEVLSGGSDIDAPRLVRVLSKVAETFAAEREDIERRAREGRRARREVVEMASSPQGGGANSGVEDRGVSGASDALSRIDDDAPERVAEYLKRVFDDTWAGFGGAPRAPRPAPVAFALTHGVRAGDRALREMAVRTLDRLGWSDLSDARTGAFHRQCATREWTEPDVTYLLDVQAQMAALFLDAAIVLGEDAYAERARAAINGAIDLLADEAGGFFESRWLSDADTVDRILVMSSNARMVRALLQAAELLHAPHFGERALATIERLAPLAYASGAGVAHYLAYGAGRAAPVVGDGSAVSGADDARAGEPAPRVRGLLVDQVETSAALIDLSQASGNRVYLELAEELMRSCLRKLWRAGHGGFLDRLRSASGGGDIGRMADPVVPFATNCQAARVLARLARETGDDSFRARAWDTLAALSPLVSHKGLLAADYALAVVDVTADVRA